MKNKGRNRNLQGKKIEQKALKKTAKNKESEIVKSIYKQIFKEFKENKISDLIKKIFDIESKKKSEDFLENLSDIQKANKKYLENIKYFKEKEQITYLKLAQENKRIINNRLFDYNIKRYNKMFNEKQKNIKQDTNHLKKAYYSINYELKIIREIYSKNIKHSYNKLIFDIYENRVLYELNKSFFENPKNIFNKINHISQKLNKIENQYKTYFNSKNKKIERKKDNPDGLFFLEN